MLEKLLRKAVRLVFFFYPYSEGKANLVLTETGSKFMKHYPEQHLNVSSNAFTYYIFYCVYIYYYIESTVLWSAKFWTGEYLLYRSLSLFHSKNKIYKYIAGVW